MTDTPDAPFSKMAERIAHNAGSTFGGAFVIVPPGLDAVPVEILFLDPNPNPAQFWGTIQAKAQMALADLEERQRRLPQGFR